MKIKELQELQSIFEEMWVHPDREKFFALADHNGNPISLEKALEEEKNAAQTIKWESSLANFYRLSNRS